MMRKNSPIFSSTETFFSCKWQGGGEGEEEEEEEGRVSWSRG